MSCRRGRTAEFDAVCLGLSDSFNNELATRDLPDMPEDLIYFGLRVDHQSKREHRGKDRVPQTINPGVDPRELVPHGSGLRYRQPSGRVESPPGRACTVVRWGILSLLAH